MAIVDDYCLNCKVHIAPAAPDRRKVTTTKEGTPLGVVHDGKCTREYMSKIKKGIQIGPPPQVLSFGRVISAIA